MVVRRSYQVYISFTGAVATGSPHISPGLLGRVRALDLTPLGQRQGPFHAWRVCEDLEQNLGPFLRKIFFVENGENHGKISFETKFWGREAGSFSQRCGE